MDQPKLSVLMTTYNHESYIRQAMESALAQQTDFPFEIVVGEDASTDGTRGIVSEVARQHPGRIKLLLHQQNVGGPANVAAALAACRGQYVAMLEGDDYWTDPLKLQKQVAAMDANPDWALCFHPARMIHEDGSKPPHLHPPTWNKRVATIDELFVNNFISTCTLVFRRQYLPTLPEWHRKVVPGDWVICLLCADQGLIGYLPDVMADYRLHGQGMWAARPWPARYEAIFRMFSRVDHHFQGKYADRIDAFRTRLVKSLVERIELLERRAQRPQKSQAHKLSRVVLRPVERVGRGVSAALGLRRKAA